MASFEIGQGIVEVPPCSITTVNQFSTLTLPYNATSVLVYCVYRYDTILCSTIPDCTLTVYKYENGNWVIAKDANGGDCWRNYNNYDGYIYFCAYLPPGQYKVVHTPSELEKAFTILREEAPCGTIVITLRPTSLSEGEPLTVGLKMTNTSGTGTHKYVARVLDGGTIILTSAEKLLGEGQYWQGTLTTTSWTMPNHDVTLEAQCVMVS